MSCRSRSGRSGRASRRRAAPRGSGRGPAGGRRPSPRRTRDAPAARVWFRTSVSAGSSTRLVVPRSRLCTSPYGLEHPGDLVTTRVTSASSLPGPSRGGRRRRSRSTRAAGVLDDGVDRGGHAVVEQRGRRGVRGRRQRELGRRCRAGRAPARAGGVDVEQEEPPDAQRACARSWSASVANTRTATGCPRRPEPGSRRGSGPSSRFGRRCAGGHPRAVGRPGRPSAALERGRRLASVWRWRGRSRRGARRGPCPAASMPPLPSSTRNVIRRCGGTCPVEGVDADRVPAVPAELARSASSSGPARGSSALQRRAGVVGRGHDRRRTCFGRLRMSAVTSSPQARHLPVEARRRPPGSARRAVPRR